MTSNEPSRLKVFKQAFLQTASYTLWAIERQVVLQLL